MTIGLTIRKALVAGDLDGVVAGVEAALGQDVAPRHLLDAVLTPGMREVGDLFEEGEYFIPEMLVAAEAMEAAMGVLQPLLTATGDQPRYRAVIGTVEGDLHDIGKRLVGMMLEGSGFEVTDVGTSVPPAEFARVVRAQGAQVVGVSALLTTTIPAMAETIRLVREAGSAHVLVGGAPVTADLASRLGADGYAPDASRAASLAVRLVG